MKKMKIDVNKVVTIIEENLKGLKEEYKPSTFSKVENQYIGDQIEELARLALTAKLRLQRERLKRILEESNEELDDKLQKLNTKELQDAFQNLESATKEIKAYDQILSKKAA